MTRRLRRAVALLAAAALLLPGCARALPVDAQWTPPEWPSAPVALAEPPAPLDPATVPGFRGHRIRNDAVGIQARWSTLPGDAALNAKVLGHVTDAVAAQAKASGTRYSPQVFPRGTGMGSRGCAQGSTTRPAADLLADPALGPAGGSGTAVTCDVLVAAGDFVGQRVRVVGGDGGAVTADSARSYYTNVATGAVIEPAQLWSDAAAAPLWEATVALLRRSSGSLSLAATRPPDAETVTSFQAALADTTVAPDGAFVLGVPAGLTSPELTALGVEPTREVLRVRVPPALVAQLASPFGAALSSAVATAQPFAAPKAVALGLEKVDCDLEPCVALTYDDGPSELTPQILDALAAHDSAATFFAMGGKASTFANTLQRTVTEGHDVANHSWNHPELPKLTPEQVTAQITNTSAALRAATGRPVRVFRPPYGAYNDAVLAAAGMAAIIWDVDTLDYRRPADEVLIARTVDRPSPGSIVLLHDIHPGTARTAPAAYEGLRDRGFTLVNLTQLFNGTLPSSGVWLKRP